MRSARADRSGRPGRAAAISALALGCLGVLCVTPPAAASETEGGTPCVPANGCYHNLAEWQNDLPGPDVVVVTDDAGIALAREVDGPPQFDNFPLCEDLPVCRLRFWRSDAEMWVPELRNSFELEALEFSGGTPPAYGMTYNDQEGSPLPHFEEAISIGDIDNWEDDDFHFEFLDGPPVHAFGFELRDSTGDPVESLRVYDRRGFSVATYAMADADSNSTGVFVGVISDEPILRVKFDEGAGGDDIAVADPRFGPTVDTTREVLRLPADVPQVVFGLDVAIDGPQLAVAACGSGTGRVSLFHREPDGGGWRDVDPNATALGVRVGSDEYCRGLDLDGQRIAMSSRSGATGTVRVALVPRSATAGLIQSVDLAGPQESMGWLVDLDGARLVTMGQSEGRVYEAPDPVGNPLIWAQVGQLQSSDPVEFFDAVSLDRDTVVAGVATFDGSSGADSGAVLVFERDAGGPGAWQQVRRLDAPDAEAGARFGASVALDGDRLVVGAPEHFSDDGGRAYVFSRNSGGAGNWGHVATLEPLFRETDGLFGASVALAPSDSVFVGSPGSNRPSGPEIGLVLRYDSVGTHQWSEPTELEFHRARGGEQWGAALAVDGTSLLSGSGGGFAYFYDPVGIFTGDFESGDLGFWSSVAR